MSEVETGKVKLTKRVWYAVWGLVPITDNSTEDLIQKYNLKNVKAKSYLSFLDYIISAFTGYFTIVTLTLEVEGEPLNKILIFSPLLHLTFFILILYL